VQLIDAGGFWRKMRKSLGSKRKELSLEHIEQITQIFGNFKKVTRDGVPISRIFKNEDFGYRTITVERPERDAKGKIVLGTKGKGKDKPLPDSSLRDTENVPLSEAVETYFKREVLPHAPDAWIDHEKTQIGYEIPFNRHFYVFQPPREMEHHSHWACFQERGSGWYEVHMSRQPRDVGSGIMGIERILHDALEGQ